jgi:hypothetical protein
MEVVKSGGGKRLAAVTDFATYEDYLDSFVKPEVDMKYLEARCAAGRRAREHLLRHACEQDEDMARQLVELGYRGTADVLKRCVCLRCRGRRGVSTSALAGQGGVRGPQARGGAALLPGRSAGHAGTWKAGTARLLSAPRCG